MKPTPDRAFAWVFRHQRVIEATLFAVAVACYMVAASNMNGARANYIEATAEMRVAAAKFNEAGRPYQESLR